MYNVKPITSRISVDCGATCLQMLLDYYGTTVDLETLIKDCGTNPTGCTAGGIKRAGEKHGLEIKAYGMSAEELIRQDRPAIIHWRANHFCVFCGMNEEGKVVICNPDRGRYPLPVKSFAAFYCGVALFNGVPKDLPVKKETVIVEITREEFNLLSIEQEVTYHIIEEDGTITIKKGVNK